MRTMDSQKETYDSLTTFASLEMVVMRERVSLEFALRRDDKNYKKRRGILIARSSQQVLNTETTIIREV